MPKKKNRSCRVCGCTDDDCSQCIKKTGHACHWVEADLCSACVDNAAIRKALEPLASLQVFNKVLKENFRFN